MDGKLVSKDPIGKVERKITVESIKLEPLCDEVVIFIYMFHERITELCEFVISL